MSAAGGASAADDRFPRARLVAPSPAGFLLVAAEVDRGPWWARPASRAKAALLARAKAHGAELCALPGVRSAVVFRAVLAAPGGRGGYLRRRRRPWHRARFDMVVLIETDTIARAGALRGAAPVAALERDVRAAAQYAEVIAARNVRRIGPVDHARGGVFLFNYFVAETAAQNLEAWESTAGWFTHETGLDNSTVLEPLEGAGTGYTIINHCRWDRLRDVLPALAFKRSFRAYVLAHFDAHDTAPLPVLYRLA